MTDSFGAFSSPCCEKHSDGLRFFMQRQSWPENGQEGGGSGGRRRPNLKFVEGFCRGLHGDSNGGGGSSKRRVDRRDLKREGGGGGVCAPGLREKEEQEKLGPR